MLNLYTTPDEIRAILGVSSRELKDETLALQVYEDTLNAELDDISLSLRSTYATLQSAPSPTELQLRFLSYVRPFAAHAVAKALTPSLPLFAPRAIGDGKASMERGADPHKATVKAVLNDYDKWRGRVSQALTALSVSTVTVSQRPFAAAAAADSNPITGT